MSECTAPHDDEEEEDMEVVSTSPPHGARHHLDSEFYAAEAMALDMDEWVEFDANEPEEPLETWLEDCAPSKLLRSDGIGWIAVRGPHFRYESETDDTFVERQLQEAWEKLKSSGRSITLQVITELAKNFRITTGKWLFYPETGYKVDALWKLIVHGIVSERLPSNSAKVSPSEGRDKRHVVCVYNDDFTNEEEVMNLETGLRKIGIKCLLQYKPDVYTELGIYRNNQWGLRPTIYRSNYEIMTGKSIIES